MRVMRQHCVLVDHTTHEMHLRLPFCGHIRRMTSSSSRLRRDAARAQATLAAQRFGAHGALPEGVPVVMRVWTCVGMVTG